MVAASTIPATRKRPSAQERARPRRGDEPLTPGDEQEALESALGADPVGIPSAGALLKALTAPLVQPGPLAREVARLGREQLAILSGRSPLGPDPRDKRSATPPGPLTRPTGGSPRAT
jgi:polyhydroxyalkanoate synthase